MPKNDYFIFDGKKSSDMGLFMASDPMAMHPPRRGEKYVVPGKNGYILREDGTFDAYTQSYDVGLDSRIEKDKVYGTARKLAAWLSGAPMMARLEDSFEPDHFRKARLLNGVSAVNGIQTFGRATLDFECQPERYLKIGEAKIQIAAYTASATIYVYDLPKTVTEFIVRSNGIVALYMKDPNNLSDSVEIQFESDEDYMVARADTTGKYTYAHLNLSIGDVTTISFSDNDGNETNVFSVNSGEYTIHNPTQNIARPMLTFSDLTTEPTPEEQTIVRNESTKIGGDGEVTKTTWSGDAGLYTSDPVNLSGYAYAIVTGVSYSFFNSNGGVVSFGHGNMNASKIVVPTGASSIVVGGSGNITAALSLLEARPNPGNAAVTIGTTTVNLDFSEQDTIILDCELHDAYYIDGSNANKKVSFADSFSNYPTFPVLPSGDVSIRAGSGENLKFIIQPRWWEI